MSWFTKALGGITSVLAPGTAILTGPNKGGINSDPLGLVPDMPSPGKIIGGVKDAYGKATHLVPTDPYQINTAAYNPNAGMLNAESGMSRMIGQREDQAILGQQKGLADMLQQRSNGQNSVVAELLRQQGENAAEQSLANARAGSAYNPGMAQMLSERAAFEARGQAAGQARMAALQEQQQAQDAYSGLLSQMRQQDMQKFGQNAGLLNSLYGMGANDQSMLGAREQLQSQNYNNAMNAAVQQQTGVRDMYGKVGGSLVGGVGSLIGGLTSFLSDERVKENITDESSSIDEFLRNIKPNGYNYKNRDHGDGWYVSPMAQELEKSKIGKSMVVDTPEGKRVDYGRGLGAMLAAQARLSKRIDNLEGARAR